MAWETRYARVHAALSPLSCPSIYGAGSNSSHTNLFSGTAANINSFEAVTATPKGISMFA